MPDLAIGSSAGRCNEHFTATHWSVVLMAGEGDSPRGKDTLQQAKTQNKPLIILGCRLCLPPELEREVTVVEFTLPGKEELGRVLNGVLESASIANLPEKKREAALDAASGLTTIEAENAFSALGRRVEGHCAGHHRPGEAAGGKEERPIGTRRDRGNPAINRLPGRSQDLAA